MNAERASLWGIILAGGEGERLKSFVREQFGADVPKQFCAFFGRRTMLERTILRARLLIPSDRLVVSGTAHQRAHMFRSLGDRPPGSVLFQPLNRDTAPGVLFPLVHILRKDPRALVALLPSDHFALPGRALMRAVAEAWDVLARTHSDSPIVLGVEPTSAETEYGWIEPGCSALPDMKGTILHVDRFVEKPPRESAERMLADGWLWNTMILVARAAALLEFIREAAPDLVAYFELIQRYIGDDQEEAIAREVYRMIPSMNFASTVLTRRSRRLLVSRTRRVRWSDWGTKERILETAVDLGWSESDLARTRRDGLAIPA